MLLGTLAIVIGAAVAIFVNDYTDVGGQEFSETIDEG